MCADESREKLPANCSRLPNPTSRLLTLIIRSFSRDLHSVFRLLLCFVHSTFAPDLWHSPANMAEEERRPKRSRFDQTEPEVKRSSRFDRRSRSPPRRSRSPTVRENPKSPSSGSDPAAAAGESSPLLPLSSYRHLLIRSQLRLLPRSMPLFKRRKAYRMSMSHLSVVYGDLTLKVHLSLHP